MKLTVCLLVMSLLGSVALRPAGAVTLQGTLVYEKIPVTTKGLDLEHPVEVPAAQVRVQLRTSDLRTILVQGDTDDRGGYRCEVPNNLGEVVLVVYSKSGRLEVADPDTNNLHYVYWTLVPANWPGKLVIPHRGRSSGSFNILATLRRADRLLEQLEPGLPPADALFVAYWSPSSARRRTQIKGQIYLGGQLERNADEYDDSVILAQYAVSLLASLSRNDSPGGPAQLRERLDPRVAWELGWALFLAQAVLGTPVYIDTAGAGGNQVLALDLEQDVLEGDTPGYWSIHSVASTLWDLFAARRSEGDHLGLGLEPIWRVLREEFPRRVFPYLITLADGLVRRDGTWAPGVTDVLARRQIEYRPGSEPSVPVPFPRLLPPGVPVTGRVDSLTGRRTNLLESAAYYLVRKESEGPLRIQLTLTDEPAPGAGHVQMVILDSDGRTIKDGRSVLWGTNSRAEIAVPLPPGTFVISVLGYDELGPFLGSASYSLQAEF
jgi:hypothetical protein